jgi:hypothetical protein
MAHPTRFVERTIAWLNRCRRLAKDWENLNRKALAFLRLASIRLQRSYSLVLVLRGTNTVPAVVLGLIKRSVGPANPV